MVVLEHIQNALANDHSIRVLSIGLMEQCKSLLRSFEMKENGELVKRKERKEVIYEEKNRECCEQCLLQEKIRFLILCWKINNKMYYP